jgi:hypothetical protein
MNNSKEDVQNYAILFFDKAFILVNDISFNRKKVILIFDKAFILILTLFTSQTLMPTLPTSSFQEKVIF